MNPAQELQLQRLRLGSFHSLDGDKIANDLTEQQDLWESFVFGRFASLPLLELLGLREGILWADTLFLLTRRDRLEQLLDLVKRWEADEVGWKTAKEQGGVFEDKELSELLGAGLKPDHALVRVWWD